MTEDLVSQIRTALEAGRRDEARALADRAFHDHPEDPQAREMYLGLHLGHAIRLSARARELRREDIVRRDIREDMEFEDSAEVSKAFDEASAEIEAVLAADPQSEKGRMMKASLLFRRDRTRGRPAALALLERVAAGNPSNRQVQYEMRKIATPCKRCGDSGFCMRCRGRGTRRILGMQSKCEACHGQGICLACGIL